MTGRRTLIAKLTGDESDPVRLHGLGYEYINVAGKDEEDLGCLSFVTVDPAAPIRAQFAAALADRQQLQQESCVFSFAV